MKTFKTSIATCLTALLVAAGVASCGTNSNWGQVLSTIGSGGTIGNIFSSVIGLDKVSAQQLIGTWGYAGPGCAFTSENLLAKAGGEVAAAQIRTKVQPYYQQIGISGSNTFITFNEDGTYSAQFRGTPMSGKWTFDEKTYKVNLQGLLLSINCYAKRNANGIGLLFEPTKLLTLLQTMAAMSGNSNIQAVGEISKNYDGVRLGFDFSK